MTKTNERGSMWVGNWCWCWIQEKWERENKTMNMWHVVFVSALSNEHSHVLTTNFFNILINLLILFGLNLFTYLHHTSTTQWFAFLAKNTMHSFLVFYPNDNVAPQINPKFHIISLLYATIFLFQLLPTYLDIYTYFFLNFNKYIFKLDNFVSINL